MATFAVMAGDTVINCIVADTLETAIAITNSECIEYTEDNPGGIGMIYVDGKFIAPVVVESINES